MNNAEVERVRVIIAHHMRPQQLADAEAGVTRRAAYRFFRDTREAGVDVLLLALADHIATHGPDVQPERWGRRVEVAEVKPAIVESFAAVFGSPLHPR